MKHFLPQFILILLGWFPAFALTSFPPDMLVNKTFSQRYFYLDLIYEKFLPVEDSAHFFSRAEEIKQLGIETNDSELEIEAELMRLSYVLHHYPQDAVHCKRLIDGMFYISNNENNQILLARIHNIAGNYYWGNNYEKAFEHFRAEYEIIKSRSVDDYPPKQRSIYHLGDRYWFFRDYSSAIKYLTEAYNTDIFGESLYFTLQATNTVGLCYQQMGNLDSADYYFMRANSIALTVGNDAWDGITSGNIGYDHYLRGHYDKAIPLLQRDLDKSILRQDWGCASGSLIILAEINLAKGNVKLATRQAQKAREWVIVSEQYGRFKTLYLLMSKLQERKRDKTVASLYLDSAAMVNKNLESKLAALQVLRLEQKATIQQEREATASHEKFTTLALQSVAFVFISILAFIVGQYINRIRRKDQFQVQE